MPEKQVNDFDKIVKRVSDFEKIVASYNETHGTKIPTTDNVYSYSSERNKSRAEDVLRELPNFPEGVSPWRMKATNPSTSPLAFFINYCIDQERMVSTYQIEEVIKEANFDGDDLDYQFYLSRRNIAQEEAYCNVWNEHISSQEIENTLALYSSPWSSKKYQLKVNSENLPN